MRSLAGSPIFWGLKQNAPEALVYQPVVKGKVYSRPEEYALLKLRQLYLKYINETASLDEKLKGIE